MVLDTNVVLSALLFGGPAGAVRRAWQAGALTPVVCRATAIELIRVLTYPKFRLAEADRAALLEEFLPWCETVVLPDPPPPTPACDDDDDVVFAQLAIACGADALVSGDAAVLALKGRLTVPVLTIAEVLARIAPPR